MFTNFQLSDRVPEDNMYRQLRAGLPLDFLYKLTKPYYGKEGNPSIDPVVFFKLMLVGYLENLQSDRAIMRFASLRLDVMFFIGYDIDEDLPWHSTLSRTRALYGQEVFKEVFVKVLGLCVSKGMVSGRRQGVDSVLVKANASIDSLTEKQMAAQVEGYTMELVRGEQEDTVPSAKIEKDAASKPEERSKGDEPRLTMEKTEKKDEGKKEEPYCTKHLSNAKHYSPTDPDARIATKPGKPRQMDYLAQVSVDLAHHVITHIQADHADKRDSECVEEVVEQTMDNLRAHDLSMEQLACDGNYSSGPVLRYLEAKGIIGYIPNFGRFKTERKGFSYDQEGDFYQCEQGAKLPFKRIKQDSRGQFSKVYRSSSADCRNCPVKSACISNNNHKEIKTTTDKPWFDRMHERMQTPYGQYMRKRRQSTVEPVIGSLVHSNGMRKIRTRGIGQASKCMMMVAMAYNLKKWLRFRGNMAEPRAGHGLIPRVVSALEALKASFIDLKHQIINRKPVWAEFGALTKFMDLMTRKSHLIVIQKILVA